MSETSERPPSPAAHGARGARRARIVAAAIVACVLFVAYVVAELRLPRGVAEFVYLPAILRPLPFAAVRGFTYEQLARHVSRFVFLGPALLAAAYVAATWTALRAPSTAALKRATQVVGVLSVSFILLLLLFVYGGRAFSDDELTYRFQAVQLLHGRLADPTVPKPPIQMEHFTVWTARGAAGKYLFGEPLVQMLGVLVGLPALLHVPMAGATLWLWYRIVAHDAGERVACWATILLAVSPMFLLTTPLGLSQPSALFGLAAAGRGLQLAAGDRPARGAAIVGLAVGFVAAVRPQTGFVMGGVLGLMTLAALVKRRRWPALLALLASGGAWVVAIALYDRALTGHALTLPWSLYLPPERYGFGQVFEHLPDYRHTPWSALQNQLVVAVRFNGWWLGWPASLGLLVVWLRVGRPRQGALPWLLGGAATLLFMFGYHSMGASDTGPIYHYELLLPACLLGAHAIDVGVERRPSLGLALVGAQLALGTTTFLGEHVARLRRMIEVTHAPSEKLLASLPERSLLLIETDRAESAPRGWFDDGFPFRYRSDSDPVVTYPRLTAGFARRLRLRYADRRCFYFRIGGQPIRPQLLECKDAEPLLARPHRLGDGGWLYTPSTAHERGLFDPFAPGAL